MNASSRGRRGVAALLGALVLLGARPSEALWSSHREIIHGTAYTLAQGEWMVGVLTPIAYGINNDFTVLVHPLMFVLLTPNLGLRYKAFDWEPATISLVLDGAGSFELSDALEDDPRPAGRVGVSTVVTFDVTGGVTISAHLGYQRDFSPDDDNFVWSATVSWLISESHLIMAQGGALYSRAAEEIVSPSASLMYAHAWETMRAGIGIAYGEFPIVVDGRSPIDINIWPVIDLWFRF